MSKKEQTTNEIILTKEIEQQLIDKATKTLAHSIVNELTQIITQYSLLANIGEEKYKLVPAFIINNLIQRLNVFAKEEKGESNETATENS